MYILELFHAAKYMTLTIMKFAIRIVKRSANHFKQYDRDRK